MNDEARRTGDVDPARERAQRRSRWGRRSLYGFPRRERTDSGPDGGGSIYGALDLGTNNCRLLVARPSGDGFQVIDAFSRIIRLGEGVSASGRLNEAAIERAVEALSICRDKMKNRGVTRARLIATEACRAAANGAELAASGCTPLIDPQAQGVILFDIGGGSSELVRLARSVPVERGPPLPQIEAWASLPVGVVTLAERHGGHKVTRDVYEAMVAEVAVFVERFATDSGG